MTTSPTPVTADELGAARAIVQLWLDTCERTFPSHRALRELAVLLRLERQTPRPRTNKRTP